MPDKYLQSLLGSSEEVILVTRQHWLRLLRAIGLEVLLAAALLVVVSLLVPAFPPIVGAYLLLAIPLGSLVLEILGWWNRKSVVTSRRVIKVSGVVNKNVIDSSLEKVNDVKMEQSFFGRLFEYGDVEILTASELAVNRFEFIADPIHFKTAMLNAKEKMGYDEIGAGGPRPPAAEDVPAMIARLDHLRQQGALTEEEFQTKKRELLAKL